MDIKVELLQFIAVAALFFLIYAVVCLLRDQYERMVPGGLYGLIPRLEVTRYPGEILDSYFLDGKKVSFLFREYVKADLETLYGLGYIPYETYHDSFGRALAGEEFEEKMDDYKMAVAEWLQESRGGPIERNYPVAPYAYSKLRIHLPQKLKDELPLGLRRKPEYV